MILKNKIIQKLNTSKLETGSGDPAAAPSGDAPAAAPAEGEPAPAAAPAEGEPAPPPTEGAAPEAAPAAEGEAPPPAAEGAPAPEAPPGIRRVLPLDLVPPDQDQNRVCLPTCALLSL